MTSPLLAIENVDAFYGQIQALRGVSLEVREHQIVALLGANGAGKSTTLKTISGLVRARTGCVRLEGEDITHKPPYDIAREGVIHVPEGRRILRGMSVTENLELGAFVVRDRRIRRQRANDVFDLFPILGERRNQDASLLSGGEQQMLAMGRAMMASPRIMLLDEPSMGLAPVLITQTMKIIKSLNESGTTVLLVEQNARLALKVAHYSYLLENGVIQMHGEASKMREDDSIIKAYMGVSDTA